ncbi:IS66 family insertion sequence element accessory protein TnpB [Endozoicomonas montiporae]|uniref:IS66 family insertion sequence element accessory protein TnpB n=1 Tax=Endozoicomonas montiporae TaxID=1027273 RepID=UPI000550725D|nr:IS66 family insertion sequence element accessory protein TnpB [Endozoicomonas montiporae]
MIRINRIWLATEPMDMRAGPDTCLARVVSVFSEAKPHQAYVFLNGSSGITVGKNEHILR